MADPVSTPSNTGTATTVQASAPIQTQSPVTPPSSTPGDWMAGFSDDMKGYIQNKGFKGAQDLADSYRNYEKLQGVPQDRLLKLPENMDSPEGRAILERLGAPKDAKGYDLKVPETNGDPKLAEWAASAFLEAGLTKSQAEKVMAKWNERSQLNNQASVENQQAAISQGEASLKKEWGAAYDQNVNLAKAGARALELDAKTLDILESVQGRDKLFKTLSKIGAGIGESAFVVGQPAGNGVLAPAQAKSRITELRGDNTFAQRLMAGEVEAKKTWDNLHKMAFPGEMNI